MDRHKILIVEDDTDINRLLQRILVQDGYDTIQAFSGTEAKLLLGLETPDLILLDLMLPGMSGEELITSVREELNLDLPILVLSARAGLETKVAALKGGADDYLTKPFHLAELNARIKSVIRRKQQDGELQLSLANLTIYPDKHSVYINGKEIVLNRKEFDLLYYFISNPNRLISKATLAESVWGDYIDQADNFDFIYSQVKNLRKKLKAAGAIPEIKAVYGFGYKMTDEE